MRGIKNAQFQFIQLLWSFWNCSLSSAGGVNVVLSSLTSKLMIEENGMSNQIDSLSLCPSVHINFKFSNPCLEIWKVTDFQATQMFWLISESKINIVTFKNVNLNRRYSSLLNSTWMLGEFKAESIFKLS